MIVFDFLIPLASFALDTGMPFKLVFDPKINVLEATVAISSPQALELSLKVIREWLNGSVILSKDI